MANIFILGGSGQIVQLVIKQLMRAVFFIDSKDFELLN